MPCCMAKSAQRPVKVMWTREDDVHNGHFRPITAHYLRAGLDASGKLIAYHQRVVGDRVLPFEDPLRFHANHDRDYLLMNGVELTSYDIPNQYGGQIPRDTGVRTCPLRGIGFTANKFVAEAFLDEVALKRSVDPMQFRLELLKNTPRGQKVLQRVAEMADWSRKRDNTAWAVAFVDLLEYADGRRRGGFGRPFDRSNKGAKFLVCRGLRHPGATRQRRCAIRGRHRLRPRLGADRRDQHRGRRRPTEQFL